jgi:glycerophosphoryl diester phosphodiesterase
MLTATELAWIAARTRRRFAAAIPFAVGWKLLQGALLAPLLAWGLRRLLEPWGRASIGNFELVAFACSPEGLVAILLGGALLLAGLYLELAGLMRLLADDQLRWWQALWGSGRMLPRLVRLGLRQLVVYVALALPFAAAIAVAYFGLWGDRDLNGLVVLRPPIFWTGVLTAGGLLLAYVVVATRWFLRWWLSVPILLFEPTQSPAAALVTSRARTQGHHRRLMLGLSAWFACQLILDLLVFGGWGLMIDPCLALAGSSLPRMLLLTSLVLLVNAALALLLSVIGTLTFASLLLLTYRQLGGVDPVVERPPPIRSPWTRRAIEGGLLVGLAGLVATTYTLSDDLLESMTLRDIVEVTAHRAGATHAPENTIAALRRAITDRADWVEIDVQLTADQALVVMHDTDLARIGGGSRTVGSVTLEALQRLDVGSLFGPEYAGERVPTLAEFLTAAAPSTMGLNIELKPHRARQAPELATRVVEALRVAGLLDRCRVCSQSYEGLMRVRQLEPRLPLGFIVAQSVGDLTKLECDFLMLHAGRITREVVDRTRLRGMTVHAWTINDPNAVAPLIDRGVTNLITDDPAAIRARLEELAALDADERLLLRIHHELRRR